MANMACSDLCVSGRATPFAGRAPRIEILTPSGVSSRRPHPALEFEGPNAPELKRMALFPPTTRTSPDRYRRLQPGWWPWMAFGLFIVALFGLVADAGRDSRPKARLLSAESSSDVPYLAKRDPLRLVAENDRRDSNPAAGWPEPVSGTTYRPMLPLPGCVVEDPQPPRTCLIPAAPAAAFRSRAPPAIA